jgi:hypothetical protein
MNHAAEDSNIGKLGFDCLILVGKAGNGKDWTHNFYCMMRAFWIGATRGHWENGNSRFRRNDRSK